MRQNNTFCLNKSDACVLSEESYCYNERNELTERKRLSVLTNYLYDANGSLIREKEGEKETGYRYDLLNRQTHVHLPDGREQENLYDGDGLRAGLKESNRISTFLYYNGDILTECDGESMPVRRYLTGQGLSHVQNLENDTFHAYHQDEQGSTAYVTGIIGEVENLYSYDGFGNILEKKEDITNRILYTGQQYDQETGQYYLRARYYNPVIGRFTQEDTYRGDGLNLYAYCGNNPVMYYDPSGYGMLDSIGAALGGCPVETNASQKNTQAEKVNGGSGYYQDANGRWHRPNGQFASNAEVGIESKSDHYLHRPYIRQKTIDAVNKKTKVDYETGQIYDRISDKWVDPSDVELGHTKGSEFAYYRDWAESQGWTQSRFNDFMNNPKFYAWQEVYSNRSHKFEEKH